MFEYDAYDEAEFDEFDEFAEFDEFEEEEDDGLYFDSEEFEEMEDLMAGALTAESEEEEDAFLGALVSAATRALPRVLSVGRRVLPRLVGVARRVVSTVSKDPNVRRAARAGVNVVARTAQDVARQVSRGGPVSGSFIARRAAGHTARVIPYAFYGRRGYPSWSRGRPYPRVVRPYRRSRYTRAPVRRYRRPVARTR